VGSSQPWSRPRRVCCAVDPGTCLSPPPPATANKVRPVQPPPKAQINSLPAVPFPFPRPIIPFSRRHLRCFYSFSSRTPRRANCVTNPWLRTNALLRSLSLLNHRVLEPKKLALCARFSQSHLGPIRAQQTAHTIHSLPFAPLHKVS
jgi:hypothetical protein